jgi:hypothetical protein
MTRGIRDVRKMADVGEGHGCGLGEESAYLALQCSIRGEETKVVEHLANSGLLVLFWGNCRGDCPFVFIKQYIYICIKTMSVPCIHMPNLFFYFFCFISFMGIYSPLYRHRFDTYMIHY